MLAELTVAVTTAPWSLSRDHLSRAHAASLSDEEVLHLVTLSSYFGHLNRIADVVGPALDYTTTLPVPPPAATTPSLDTSPKAVVGRPAIALSRRPATQAALADWRNYIFYRDTPVSRRTRTLLARWVAVWIGDGGISPPMDLTANPHDDMMRMFAEVVTLAPWSVTDETFAPLRRSGMSDAEIFDAAATISSATVFSRIEVALVALGQ